MTAKVLKIEVKKDNGSVSRRYVVCVDPDVPMFDITKELEQAWKVDQGNKHASEKGPAFGHTIHNALRAFDYFDKAWFGQEEPVKVAFPGQGSFRRFADYKVVREWAW